MTDNILKISNVVKQYQNHLALNNLSLEIPRGCIYGLLGPNGAGKTTLMKIINQITAPDSGLILFNGVELKREHIAEIGYLPEERGLYKKMKVGEQALYLSRLKGLSKSEALEKLKFWFEKLNVLQWWDKKVEELSKGMAQKIQFAIAIIHNPQLLIFDEPFTGFDPVNTAIIRDEILNLKKNGTSIIFSTHRMESVEQICDEITLINNGESILEGKIEEVKNNFTSNTYKVELDTTDIKLNEVYKIISKIENKLIIKITDDSSPKKLINNIIKSSDIISFNKIKPSMEEIFIKTVDNG